MPHNEWNRWSQRRSSSVAHFLPIIGFRPPIGSDTKTHEWMKRGNISQYWNNAVAQSNELVLIGCIELQFFLVTQIPNHTVKVSDFWRTRPHRTYCIPSQPTMSVISAPALLPSCLACCLHVNFCQWIIHSWGWGGIWSWEITITVKNDIGKLFLFRFFCFPSSYWSF